MILTGIVAGTPRTRPVTVKKGTPEQRVTNVTEVGIVDQDSSDLVMVNAWDTPDAFKDAIPGKSYTVKVGRVSSYKGQSRATIAGQKPAE
jgi:hypothetical protein